MKIYTRSGTLLCAVLVVTACGGDSPEQALPAPAPAPSATSSPAGEQVPSGRYSRVVTVEDAEGVDDETVTAMLGADGEMPMTIEIDGDSFSMHVTNDAAVSEVGDLGTVSYDAAGRLVLTSEAVDVVQVFDWTMDGEVLTLALVEGPPEDRFVVDGTYTRDS